MKRLALIVILVNLTTVIARADPPVSDEQLTKGSTFHSAPLVSNDGTVVVYRLAEYDAPGRISRRQHVRLLDRTTGIDRPLIDQTFGPATWATALSGDGNTVALTSYLRLTSDSPEQVAADGGIYVYHVPTNALRFVGLLDEVLPSGITSLSADGNVAAGKGPDYRPKVLNLTTGGSVSAPATLATLEGSIAMLSGDGQTLVFTTGDERIDPRDDNRMFDVYAFDIATGIATLVSVGHDDMAADGDSYDPIVSFDGNTVAFSSNARSLTDLPLCMRTTVTDPGSTCERQIYVRDLSAGRTELVSVSNAGTPAEVGIDPPVRMSADARYVVFRTRSTSVDPFNQLPSAWSGRPHVRDRVRGTTLPMQSPTNKVAPFPSLTEFALAGDGHELIYSASSIFDRASHNLYAAPNPSLS